MLTALQIRDFAIIDELELTLRTGLTVLTGETGAGKSIVVDALQLLAGGRAGADMIRHGATRAEISATFDVRNAPAELADWLERQAIEDTEIIVRRMLGSDGRSRAWLNGQPVPVQLLREAGNLLIDIHGQHEFQSLARAPRQRALLDEFGALNAPVSELAEAYRRWRELNSRERELAEAARDRDAQIELLRHQVGELQALELAAEEFARLSEERERLAHRGRLAEATQAALALLYEDESRNAHGSVGRALQALRPAAAIDPGLEPIVTLAQEAEVNIREAARELERYGEALQIDTTRQDAVEGRLAAIEDLARKHRVAPAELPARLATLAGELEALEHAEVDLQALRRELATALETYRQRAAALSGARARAAEALGTAVTGHMQTLGMAGGRFVAAVTPRHGEPGPHGDDDVEFQVSANPGQPVRPLAKVASGGELSRLSLAVEVASSARETRCMIFDEVDSGIGGAVAEIVGRELRALGERGQVLCVTHLPQVASQGHQHLQVAKCTEEGTTRTRLAELAERERVEELARMLGGVDVTATAREHAREMLTSTPSVPARRRAKRAARRR